MIRALSPADATALVTNPAAHPALRQTAWADLKAARGQPVDFARLGLLRVIPLGGPRAIDHLGAGLALPDGGAA